MNIKSQLIKTLILFITFIVSEHGHTTGTITYTCEERLDINDFTHQNLQKYNIDESSGVIYRTDRNTTIYPVYEGRRCYDLKTEIDKIKETYKSVPDICNGGNLVVKSTSDAYVVDDKHDCYNLQYNKKIVASLNKSNENFLSVKIPSNVNIIIPHDVTLVQSDVTFHIEGSNVNLIVLGKITNCADYNYVNALFYFPSSFCNVIIGPQAEIKFNNVDHDSIFWLEQLSSSIIMYPGCTINTTNPGSNSRNTVNLKSKLYLNRYTQDLSNFASQINGVVSEQMEVIYPENIANSYQNNKNILMNATLNSNSYMKTDYFPNIYWRGNVHNFGYKNGYYNFESVKPLSYNEDETREKFILGLNPNNKFAKYDIAFWNKCKFNGQYGFNQYNKKQYKASYIDLNTIDKLFHGMKRNENTVSLPFNTNVIYPGLIGSLSITINLNNVENHDNTLFFHGDNREFKGILIVPNEIKTIFYSNENSKIKNILQLDEDGNIKNYKNGRPDLSDINILYGNAFNWSIYHNDTMLTIDNNFRKDSTIVIQDKISKKVIVEGVGNPKGYNTLVLTFKEFPDITFAQKPCDKRNMQSIKMDCNPQDDDKVKTYKK
ncbi:MAG: hypothetical protein IJ848_02825 [Alphaproteobacteria bacterium]|nr:hypothetical protein [Alphaproteobacteria bacterium]